MAIPETFLICGAGGHGRVVCDAIRAMGAGVAGFLDGSPGNDPLVLPGGVQLPVEADTRLDEETLPFGATAVALGVGDNRARLRIAGQVASRHRMPVVIHPRATVADGVTIGAGSVILMAAAVGTGVQIGDAAIINTGAIVDHDCRVGPGAHVSPGAVVCGGVHLGARVWIGAGATVIPGVRIGDNAIVAAGAVVLHDVEPGARVAGVPARPLPDREAVE